MNQIFYFQNFLYAVFIFSVLRNKQHSCKRQVGAGVALFQLLLQQTAIFE